LKQAYAYLTPPGLVALFFEDFKTAMINIYHLNEIFEIYAIVEWAEKGGRNAGNIVVAN
jgi:hypothetical protein